MSKHAHHPEDGSAQSASRALAEHLYTAAASLIHDLLIEQDGKVFGPIEVAPLIKANEHDGKPLSPDMVAWLLQGWQAAQYVDKYRRFAGLFSSN